jgi:hypothetical protein
MDETPDPNPRDKHPLFEFVEAGMRLTHEFASLGQLACSFGNVIEFRPVLSVIGWSDRKEFQAALRMRHLDPYGRELGVCLLDRDEARCWTGLLNACLCRRADDPDNVELERLVYISRHGAKLVGRNSLVNGSPWVLQVGTEQTALLPIDFTSTLLDLFAEFESLCERYS